MKIKVSELFYSLQGEGLYQGVPSVFMRVFGCNFTCSGFGMPKGQLSIEYKNVDPTKYKSYDDLPLVHTGCDSYPSWDVRFKHLSPMLETDTIVERIRDLLPEGKFGNNVHFIITGGEPLLGWQRAYPELLEKLSAQLDLKHVTIETNGTQKLQDPFANALETYCQSVTFSVSSKLTNSGEKWEEAIRPEIISQYSSVINGQIYFKWVCSNPEDFEDVQRAVQAYDSAGLKYPVYLMPAGGTEKLYHKNKQWLAKVCMAHGYRFSPRLQIDLFGNQWAT